MDFLRRAQNLKKSSPWHYSVASNFKWKIFSNFVPFSESLNFNGQIYGGDFAKFCGLLRIYELYQSDCFDEKIITNKQTGLIRIPLHKFLEILYFWIENKFLLRHYWHFSNQLSVICCIECNVFNVWFMSFGQSIEWRI